MQGNIIPYIGGEEEKSEKEPLRIWGKIENGEIVPAESPVITCQYLEEDNRPQVTMDVDYENGMGVSVGRIREDSVYDYKFVGLSHNTVRGAAGGAILCAETLKAKGFIQAK